MNAFAFFALGLFPLAALGFFFLLPIRIALAVTVVIGTMFLPIAQIDLPVINYDKKVALCYAILLGMIVGHASREKRTRLSCFDLPVIALVLSGGMTSLANGNGAYDAFSEIASAIMTRAVPYTAGRLFFSAPHQAWILVRALAIGGLAYSPLCLWEIRMSPQLHRLVYGQHQHDFVQSLRGSGYRPTVFMYHGLTVSLWMVLATLAVLALWRFGKTRNLLGLPLGACFLFLATTSALCKSTGATILGLIGMIIMLSRRSAFLTASLVVCAFIYVTTRILDMGLEEHVTALLTPLVSDRAASSMTDRMTMEALFIERAWQQPLLGCSTWDFNAHFQMADGTLVRMVCDSAWIIAFAAYGLVGACGYLLMFGLPPLMAAVSHLRRLAGTAPVAHVLSVLLVVVLVDSLANTPESPFYLMLTGCLASLVAPPPPARLPTATDTTTHPARARDSRRMLSKRLPAQPAAPANP